ncbi:hypothetical protein G6O69_06125 [Pseudenhygromyxa sp. WMMC2535]|uniref:hypothetical protein n=1 Tax=Pseudenhygromyxa sp. WMMC2535 TaxID=2712867 RepID=UPI0015531F24|nr:hypothetical protein [Pseudenhygromyxa sp. WMMC2535]NVB37401.1 hypothetical protein [Pseudenhygromyxa sp. WMMC2535]
MPGCLPLIRHLFDSIQATHFRSDPWLDLFGIYGFGYFGDNGICDVQTLRNNFDNYKQQCQQMIQWGVMDRPTVNDAPSCGQSANALCAMFKGNGQRTRLQYSCELLSVLRQRVSDGRPRLLRIQVGSHAYVIEQVATPLGNPLGNVYQSNIAVYGYTDRGISLKDYLDHYNNPIDLLQHLDLLAELARPGPRIARYRLYKRLFLTDGFIQRNSEEEIIKGFNRAHCDGLLDQRRSAGGAVTRGQLQVTHLSWAPLTALDIRQLCTNVETLLSYHVVSASQARALAPTVLRDFA